MNNVGILLVNLGSPDSPNVRDVRRYLNEFLMDRHVMDLPYIKRALIVKGLILPFRPKRSAAAYRSIWTLEGSPLKLITARVAEKLQARIPEPVEYAMRYANPSIEFGIHNLIKRVENLSRLIVVPLYPHFAMSSAGSVKEKLGTLVKKNAWKFSVHIAPPFYNDPLYLKSLANSIRPYLEKGFDQYLFSYHGLPESHIRKLDKTGRHCLVKSDCCAASVATNQFCYRHHCFETTRLVAEELGLGADKFCMSFQSRLGREPWLKPFTDVELREMPSRGIRKLAVICPAFVADCLETLEEISIRGKEIFEGAGGDYLFQIPCLNDRDDWIDALVGLCRNSLDQNFSKTPSP